MRRYAFAFALAVATVHAQDYSAIDVVRMPADHGSARTIYPKVGKGRAIVRVAHLPDGRWAYMVDSRVCFVELKGGKSLSGMSFLAIPDGAANYVPDGNWGCAALMGNKWITQVATEGTMRIQEVEWHQAPELDYVVYQKGIQ